jgi:nitrous oxidase accessory protein NosD
MFKASINSSRALRAAFAVTFFAVAASLASAATLCVNPNGHGGCKSTISAAVAAASAGDIIQVAPGTYTEQVTISIPLSLVSSSLLAKPVINASGKGNGIFVNGVWASPAIGIANVVVSGFDIRNANFEGILVTNATNVTLLDNHVHDNNKALPNECPGIPAYETNEADDCGEGIHLMAVNHSFVLRNLIENNSGGILISDETGPNASNLIRGNIVRDNSFDCGITLASHPAANASGPINGLPFGISHNVISHNQSYRNGRATPGAGAGVGIFAPFPGTTDTANVVIGNDLHDNGLPGVTMHNHAWAPSPAPAVNLNDNVIIGNHIYGNLADTEDAFTSGPTGINIYSVAPITGTVVAQNTFNDESIDIAFNAPSGSLDVHFNDFNGHDTGIDNLGAGLIDATNNWWNCISGPGSHCATVTGPAITTSPWLSLPFDFNLDGY